jgi:hypothetical protein
MAFEGICKLCGNRKPLMESHLVPHFVTSWLRETGSGYFRLLSNPNIKYQDLPQYRFLCDACEGRFSRREKYFSENIFSAFLKSNPKTLSYTADFYYFLISVLWRLLIRDLSTYKKGHKKFVKEIEKHEEDWRLFLLEERKPSISDVHLFITDILRESKIPVKNFNRYMVRALDSTVMSNGSECYAYAKLARFCIFAPLTAYDKSKWINTEIVNGNGTWSSPQEIKDGKIGEFLIDRIKSSFKQFQRKISERQKIKIHEYQKKNLEKVINSELGEVLLQDSFAPVDTSFFPKRKIRRNELCPCGSNLKYKKCHGLKED